MSSAPSSPEKPRKLLRWTDSSELEDVPRERPSTDSASHGTESETSTLSKREDWYAVKMQRLKEQVDQLRKDLQGKERDYIRLKNKYNVSKRRQAQLQEEAQKYSDKKLDLDSELEFLRLQIVEKDKQLSRQSENDGESVGKNGRSSENGSVKDYEIDDVDESFFAEDSVLSRRYLNLHKETRKLFTYILLSISIFLSLIALVTRSAFLSTIVAGLWTIGLSCLWTERKHMFRVFKMKYLQRIREVSVEKSSLRVEHSKLESMLKERDQELTNERRERDDVVSKLKTASEKLSLEMAKNEELVKLEKSTFEELQSERVRRRRAEEQLEEVSAQVLLAQEKNEIASCGDVCQELRNNLKLERESKEKLLRENERLIKEIVQMNMTDEKERLKQEGEKTQERIEVLHNTYKRLSVEIVAKADENADEVLRYTNKQTRPENDGKVSEELEKVNGKEKDTSAIPNENKAIISNEDDGKFDIKECESVSSIGELHSELIQYKSIKDSLQTTGYDEMKSKNDSNTTSLESSSNMPKDCWLCAWNIPNETSLALLIIILACLVLMLKVVLSNNVYMFLLLMTAVAGFTYYQVARNIENSN